LQEQTIMKRKRPPVMRRRRYGTASERVEDPKQRGDE
jgi:hypothetical protein